MIRHWNAAEVAILAKLAVQPELLLVALEGDLVVGSLIAGYDGQRGWLYTIAVAVLNARCRQGVGTALVGAAQAHLRSKAAARSTCRSGAQTPPLSSFTGDLGI